jgi:leucyl aminopeptidase
VTSSCAAPARTVLPNRCEERRERAGGRGRGTRALGRHLRWTGASSRKAVEPLLEGFVLNSYRFDKYRSKKNDDSEPKVQVEKVTIAAAPAGRTTARSAIERLRAVCDAVFLARDLINEMSSVKTPTYLGKQAKEIAKKHGLECQVWQGEKLVKSA